MEEKIYDLITKLYGEMQTGFANLHTEMQDGIGNIRGDITNMQGDIKNLYKGQAKLEIDLKDFKTALFDGYKQTYEKLEFLEQKVDKLAVTIESHDVKIEVIRGAK